jgi:hypothetical protein
VGRRRVWVAAAPALALCCVGVCAGAAHATSAFRISARLSYNTVGADEHVADVRFRIFRSGTVKVDEPVPHWPGRPTGAPRPGGSKGHPTLTFPDLDRDGEPEVVLDLSDGHVWWWRVYSWNAARHRYTVAQHLWGADRTPTVKSVRRNGKLQIVANDQRFSGGPFAGLHGPVFPVRVWSFHAGKFRDVSRAFPELLQPESARLFRRVRSGADSRAAAGAWAADEARLGRAATAHAQLRAWAGAGALQAHGHPGLSGAAFVGALWGFLGRLGYVTHS